MKNRKKNKKKKDNKTKKQNLTEVGLMVPSVIHDIRGYLSIIKAQAQLALNGKLEEGTKIRLKKILDQINLIEEIIEEFRDFYKKGEVKRREIKLSEIVEQALAGVSHKIKSDINIIRDIHDSTICVNRIMIRQALVNLLSNAIDAIDQSEKKIIGIASRNINGKTYIWVFDSGKGIPKKLASKLFNTSFTTKDHGTGLGLLITKKIIDAHKAKIRYAKNIQKIQKILKLPEIKTIFEIEIPDGEKK
ncbi:MAG: ATP-binding protein [Candidatus Pacearchaeota archaeon]